MRLTRKPPKRRKPIQDDWSDAEVKRGPCRKCGSWPVELAHTVGKRWQNVRITSMRRWVPPEAVIPLCKEHHMAFDGRRMPLTGLLYLSEYRNAYWTCKRVGLDFKRRIGGGRS